MTDFETALAARFAALTDTDDDSDWLDVERRMRSVKRRRALTVSLIAAAAALIVAPAWALRGPIIDFFSADTAPAPVVRDFGTLQVGAPPGMAPGVRPGQARRVTSVRIDGKTHVLYVAPTTGGGFCESWTHAFGGCRSTRTLPVDQAARLTPNRLRSYNAMGTTFEGNADGATQVGGHVLVPGSTVELRYEDSASVEIPYVWVSKPIDAGFFLYGIPFAHRKVGHRATALVLLDKDGHEIGRETFHPYAPRDVVHRLSNGRKAFAPAQAVWAKRRVLIDFRSARGQKITLWVAPSRTGGRCYWWNQGSACLPAGAPIVPPVQIGLTGAPRSVRVFGPVAANVATVTLNYQDGTTDTIMPTQGFVLEEIPASHYPKGHRLVSTVGYDQNGHVVGQSPFQPDTPGLYPCNEPKSYGYGVKQCP
jgi:hypothetical protein